MDVRLTALDRRALPALIERPLATGCSWPKAGWNILPDSRRRHLRRKIRLPATTRESVMEAIDKRESSNKRVSRQRSFPFRERSRPADVAMSTVAAVRSPLRVRSRPRCETGAGRRARPLRLQLCIEERDRLLPRVLGRLGVVALRAEIVLERVVRAVVAVEGVLDAGFREGGRIRVDVLGGRAGVEVAEEARDRAAEVRYGVGCCRSWVNRRCRSARTSCGCRAGPGHARNGSQRTGAVIGQTRSLPWPAPTSLSAR